MFKQGGPAPVPADGLAAALAPFGQSRMLPREAYVDPAVFEWEQHNIFSGWTCVGHTSDLGGWAPRKQWVPARTQSCWCAATTRSALSPTPAATVDTNCWRATRPPRAAASSVPTTRGRTGWTAGCATRRDSAMWRASNPTSSGWPNCGWPTGTAGCSSMPAVKTPNSPTHVAGLDAVIGPYRPEDLTIVARHSYVLTTNWKVIAENYQECYHCSTIHPELSRISPPTSGENLDLRVHGWGAGCRSSRAPRPCR